MKDRVIINTAEYIPFDKIQYIQPSNDRFGDIKIVFMDETVWFTKKSFRIATAGIMGDFFNFEKP